MCHDHRDIPFAASFEKTEYIYTDDVYSYLFYLKNTKLNLSFRLHSFIPSLALDIPTIKISYDERAISVLDSIGMKEWNINLLTDDIIDEVENRLNKLKALEDIKDKCKLNEWETLRTTITQNCNKFADIIVNS